MKRLTLFRHPSVSRVINAFESDVALSEIVIDDPPTKKKTDVKQKEKGDKMKKLCMDIKGGNILVPDFLNTVGYLLKC